MKIQLICLFMCCAGIYAGDAYSQEVKVSIVVKNATVKDILHQIEKKTDYLFLYNQEEVDLNRQASLNAKGKRVSEVLSSLFNGTDTRYVVEGNNIVLMKQNVLQAATSQQDTRRISGTVTDEKGEPVIGANVIEKGTTNGNITDVDGKFTLDVSPGATLVISFIGYVKQEIAVGSRQVITVTLLDDASALEEVVVTALGIKRQEKALGYAVQTIKGNALTDVKGVEIATSLTGKVAGLTVYNTSEFQDDGHGNMLKLRGEDALIVIDGFPSAHTSLRDYAADDIESITVLKGSTASALYGSRGSSGAIMVTTKRGAQKEGLSVGFNSSEMFNSGFVALPEAQSSYSAGTGGKYNVDDYVWGDKLDIGRTAPQYDPFTYEVYDQPLVSKGKNNFKNFLQPSYTTNNNVNVTYTGKQGSFRTSANHIYQKGYYPNTTANRFNLNVAGNMHIGKFSLDASVNYTKRIVPNTLTNGYSQVSPVYTIITWMGADWDIRDYKDYWRAGQEGVVQNFSNSYYNNPWLIQHEYTKSQDESRYNAQLNASYDITDWLKATARVGSDQYVTTYEEKKTQAYKRRGEITGGDYRISDANGYSFNTEGLLLADKTFADFNVNGFVGASLYYTNYRNLNANVAPNGQLSSPGFYSLLASNGAVQANSGLWREQRNAVFGKVGASWKSAVFLDVTGRNDWSSTLDAAERSYFYPSVSGSLVLTEFLPKIDWLNFWKLRGSWTQTKLPVGIYDINQAYAITANVWNNIKGAAFSKTIRSGGLKPRATEGWEIGTAINVLDNRLRFDLAYYQKLYYNNQSFSALSDASGFNNALVNTDEQYLRKGVEITLSGDVVRTKDFLWTATANWSTFGYTYHKLDETYSSENYWVEVGKPANLIVRPDWLFQPGTGELILQNGMPVASNYSTPFNADPDWVWGFNNEFKYKNVNLNVALDGRVGGYGYNEIEVRMWMNGSHPDSDNSYRYEEVVNGNRTYIAPGVKVVSGDVKFDASGRISEDTRVYEPNDVAVGYEQYIRGYWSSNNRSARGVFDKTFLKLREVSLGYTLPKDITQKIKMQNVQVSLVGQNLFLWAKAYRFTDPDSYYDIRNRDNNDLLLSPSERLIGFNVKIDF